MSIEVKALGLTTVSRVPVLIMFGESLRVTYDTSVPSDK